MTKPDTSISTPRCIQCRYVKASTDGDGMYYDCTNQFVNNRKYDVVTGRYDAWITCAKARSGICGKEGKYFLKNCSPFRSLKLFLTTGHMEKI